MITKALDWLERIVELVAVLALAVVVVAVSWQVIARYVTEASTAWAPELAQIAFVWCALLAIPIGVRRSKHLMIDVWFAVKNTWIQVAVSTAAAAIVVGVSATLAYFGYDMLGIAMSRKLPGLGIAAGWANLAVPVGFGLCVVFGLEAWWKDIRSRLKPDGGDPSESTSAPAVAQPTN